MDWPKVKTILIFFLLMINLLIGALFVSRKMEDARIEREMIENVVSGLDNLGVTISIGIFETETAPLYMLEVERDTDLEISAFSTLLDSPVMEELGGGNLMLTSGDSWARLSGDGLFDVFLSGKDRVKVIKPGFEGANEVFKQMGIDISGDHLSASETQDGVVVKGIQILNGRKIFNRNYEISFASGELESMRGGRILGNPLVCDATPSVSLASAVFAFADKMIKNGTPCREITGATLGYYAESSAPGFTRITPAWEIVSDLGTYYVDAISLEPVSQRSLPR
ncbi:MAG: hypothetical protein ACOX1Q_09025 [Eubacteriales bacterium]